VHLRASAVNILFFPDADFADLRRFIVTRDWLMKSLASRRFPKFSYSLNIGQNFTAEHDEGVKLQINIQAVPVTHL